MGTWKKHKNSLNGDLGDTNHNGSVHSAAWSERGKWCILEGQGHHNKGDIQMGTCEETPCLASWGNALESYSMRMVATVRQGGKF